MQERKERSVRNVLLPCWQNADDKNEEKKLCPNIPLAFSIFCCPYNSFHQMWSKGYVQTSSKSLTHWKHTEQNGKLI